MTQEPSVEPNPVLVARASALQDWFCTLLPALNSGTLQGALQSVSGDASFRRYFRGFTTQASWILVDAPPDKENSHPFVVVASLLARGGVAVPQVFAADLQQGFMCLGDFGDELLWTKLDAARMPLDAALATKLYQSAFTELLKIQQCPAASLPAYDTALLLREMRLFTEWFCGGLMSRLLSAAENAMLEQVYAFLAQAALAQPQVFVHRDYHSRNLMYREGLTPGVLDFQDAVQGPVTYDLVSLLKDCYIEWPRAQVQQWALHYAELAVQAKVLVHCSSEQWLHDFDLMGAQRHLKVLGIFSRLWLRDDKAGYLKDIPLTMRYLVSILSEHSALAEFSAWLHAHILPELDAALARCLADSKAGARQ